MKKEEKTLERQTSLELKELIYMIGSNSSCYPTCLLINEVGVIVCTGNDESELGEKCLLGLLNDHNENHRMIAHSYLSHTKDLAEKHAKVLAKPFEPVPQTQTELEKLVSAGWFNTNQFYGSYLILKKDEEMILFNQRNDKIESQYGSKKN